MNGRKLRVSDDTAAFVRSLHPHIKKKIKAGLADVLESPSLGKSLKDDLSGLRSHRVGKFRIIYKDSADVIEIIAIGPRKSIYEETLRLLKRNLRDKEQ